MVFFDIPNKVPLAAYGTNSGLIVYVNTSVIDFFYTTEPFIGFRVSNSLRLQE